MPENTRPESEFHQSAHDEIDYQVGRRIAIARSTLRNLSALIAREELDSDDATPIVLRTHVIQAVVEILSKRLSGTTLPLSVFLSYASEQVDFAVKVYDQLLSDPDPMDQCFLARESIRGGEPWPKRIWQSLRSCRLFVPMITKEFLNSQWCLAELGVALALQKRIIPIRFDAYCSLPDPLHDTHAELVDPDADLSALVAALKAECGK
ncbi:MAG: toll/interleukin-1 receptor domain-containing protein [Planctomycetes bacterium]|nr:toll/interleukin-1 receptor domain-containing protein [Planctomycetota bacterium]